MLLLYGSVAFHYICSVIHGESWGVRMFDESLTYHITLMINKVVAHREKVTLHRSNDRK